MNQSHAFHGYRTQAIGRCAYCGAIAENPDGPIRFDGSLYRERVDTDPYVRKDEIEGMRAGGLQDESDRGIERARSSESAHVDNAVAERLTQRLNARIQDDAEITISILMTAKN